MRQRRHVELPRRPSTGRCGWSPALRRALRAQFARCWSRSARCRSGCGSARRSAIGAVAVVIGLVLRLWGMSQWIMWEVSGLFENIGTVQDGIGSISLPRAGRGQAGRARTSSSPRGEIRFDHVGFHYGSGKGVIDDLSLTVRPGEKVGLVGRSGAGKSTLVNLLLRFYDLESGRILIDGQDIAAVTQDIAARPDRHGHAGHLAAASLGARQHPLRPARTPATSDDGRGGAARRGARFHRGALATRRAARASTRMSASAA